MLGQVLGCSGTGASSDTLAGIEWAVADALASGVPSVLSMSLGGGFSEAQNQAVAQAVASATSSQSTTTYTTSTTTTNLHLHLHLHSRPSRTT